MPDNFSAVPSPSNPGRWSLALMLVVAGALAATNVQARQANSTATKPDAAQGKPGGKAKARLPGPVKSTAQPARAAATPTRARTRFARTAAASGKAHHRSGRSETKTVLLERRVPAVKGGLPNVQALGALVLDENGHELYARNADHERPIASISKLAATLAVMDRGLELDGLSTITRADLDVARGGARSRLLQGMTLSNRDLLHAALMGSDNRAIPALGRAVHLSSSQLAAAMTVKAKELGLAKTRFRDPTGLSIENVSTPRETIALLRAVVQHPVLGPITQRVEYDAHPIGKPPIRYINTYRPAMRNHVQVLGGKTGYNDDARYCLVLAAKIDGHTCYMSFLANEGKLTRFGDVARVADWVVSRKPKGQGQAAVLAAASPVPAAALASVDPEENTSTTDKAPPRSEPAGAPLPAAQAFSSPAFSAATPACADSPTSASP